MFDYIRSSYDLGPKFTNVEMQTKDIEEDRTPYYIGKGKGNRVYAKHRKGINVPKGKKRIIFLKQNLTEEQAFIHEKYMIFVFGRKDLETGILRNLSDGGEGNSGLIHNEETKRKISEAVKGKNHPLYGISPSEETKKKMSKLASKRNIGRKWRNNGQTNKFVVECPGDTWVSDCA